MMLEEFAKLTGFTPEKDYYTNEIEWAYTNSPLEKKEWCEQWLANGGIQNAYDTMKEDAEVYKTSYECAIKEYRGLRDDYDKLLKEKNNLLKERDDAIKEIKSIKEYVESAIDSMSGLRNSYNEVMEELNAI